MIDYNIISTGSQGNAVVIEHKILIDCGVSFKALAAEYRTLKLVLLTHIHSDHFHPSTLRLLASNRPTLRFACCAWLCKPLVDAGVPVSQIDVLDPGHLYGYGICNVIPHMVKHNVPNCGWKVWLDGRKLFYCTDMNNLNGISAPNYDLYMVEANYDDKDIQAKIAEKKLTGECRAAAKAFLCQGTGLAVGGHRDGGLLRNVCRPGGIRYRPLDRPLLPSPEHLLPGTAAVPHRGEATHLPQHPRQ